MEYQNLLNKFIISCLSATEDVFFDQLLQKINDHYDGLDVLKKAGLTVGMKDIKNKNKDKGNLFEFLCLRLIQLNVFKGIRCKEAWLFKDLPNNLREQFKFTHKDMGIDIIVNTIDNKWLAVQCKYKKKSAYSKTPNGQFIKHQIGWKSLSTFYSLCDRTGPVSGWNKHVVITTAASVNRQGRQNNKDLNICVGTFKGLPKDTWFAFIGESGHKLTDAPEIIIEKPVDVNEVRTNRLKFLDALKK
jgi:hypothetical protein